jgi:hypothetical protein
MSNTKKIQGYILNSMTIRIIKNKHNTINQVIQQCSNHDYRSDGNMFVINNM